MFTMALSFPSELFINATAAGPLCARCETLNLNDALRAYPSIPVRIVMFYDTLVPIDCELCRFLSRSLGSLPANAPYDLLAIHIGPLTTPLLDPVNASILCLSPLQHRPNGKMFSFFDIESFIIYAQDSAARQTLRPIPPLVDVTMIKRWLGFCFDSHSLRCCTDESITHGLRVIDCESRYVIQHPAGAAYIAVSYVWGNPSSQLLLEEHHEPSQSPNSLPSFLPQTIEDCITITQALGYRYLWVDKYCLDQDHEDFDIQLKHMDLVYQNATLTVVAAAGIYSTYGLPGVSRPRLGSPTIGLSSRTLASVPFPVDEDLGKSTWSSRAWTYQEGLLSTRRLIFTDRQVYFECQGYYCFEGLAPSRATLSGKHVPMEQRFHISLRGSSRVSMHPPTCHNLGVFPRNKIGSTWDELRFRIEEYSKRSLTYENDILRAFLGILGRYEKESMLQTLWGVPFRREQTHGRDPLYGRTFDCALPSNHLIEHLFWVSVTPSTRREGFPSWSWT
jgi:hypothetical protein